jgi:hypothetical protein
MNRMQLVASCLVVGVAVCTAKWMNAQAASSGNSAQNDAAQKTPPPPPQFTPTPEMLAIQAASEKDHQRVMNELGIKELRPPVDNDIHSPHPVNYDESKANVYQNVPDPLVMKSGEQVTSAEMWWKQRRPEIVELFDREIYGRTPEDLP